MTQNEIKELSTKDLAGRIIEEKASLVKTKMGHKVSPIENPLKIRDVRKTIARMQTELRKRQLAEAKK
jgi:large subunit ribosomal protein L29